MKVARLVIALAAALLAITVVVLPQIIGAKHYTWLGAGRDVSAAPAVNVSAGQNQQAQVTVGVSDRNDTSKPLRDMKQLPVEQKAEHEANENPKLPNHHIDSADPVVQGPNSLMAFAGLNMPSPLLNFDGVPFPGVACNCAPPDTNGEVGATQYVQIVNEGYQVFNKTTGASLLGPSGITTLWSGFGGVCQTNGSGDPVV